MLVLSRKKNQTIVVDGNIRIQVLSIKGNSIKLGIIAPAEVGVLRGELAPFGKVSSESGNENELTADLNGVDGQRNDDFVSEPKIVYGQKTGQLTVVARAG